MNKKAITISALLLVVLGSAAALSQAWEPVVAPVTTSSTGTQETTMIRRGAQLAAVGDCMVCHTAQGGKPFAGGRPLNTPFGTIFFDQHHARCGYRYRQLVARGLYPRDAQRRRTRRPSALSRVSLCALHAHQRHRHRGALRLSDEPRRRPCHGAGESPRLPLNFRPLVAGWNLLYRHPGEITPDPSQSVEWNRGRYLFEGLGHCAACHSPMNTLGAEKSGQAFAGGNVDGWDAPRADDPAGPAHAVDPRAARRVSADRVSPVRMGPPPRADAARHAIARRCARSGRDGDRYLPDVAAKTSDPVLACGHPCRQHRRTGRYERHERHGRNATRRRALHRRLRVVSRTGAAMSRRDGPRCRKARPWTPPARTTPFA